MERSVKTKVGFDKYNIEVKFEIEDLVQENVLYGDVAEKLGLLSRFKVDTANKELTELIKTTRTLSGEYSIKFKENVQGLIHPTHRLPVAIRPRATEKLCAMEDFGYVIPVIEPTEWVSIMGVSCKKDKIRICINLKYLNKVIKREHQPMNSIDNIITEIPDAKVFYALNAKSGFLQVRLDTQSSYLTTTRTVRESDYSPAVELSEQKDK